MQLATDLQDYAAGALGLVEQAASYLNDRTHRMWSKGELIVHINDAQLSLAASINAIHKEYFLKSGLIPLIAAQAYYTMPADLAMLAGLEVVTDTNDREPHEMVSIHLSDRRFYEGLELATKKEDYQFFFVAGTTFKAMPEPATTTGEQIRAHYVKRLTTLVNNTDVSEIPVQNHGLLAMDAARLAQIKTKQTNLQLERMRAERFAAMEAEVRVFTITREESVEPFYGTFGPILNPNNGPWV